MARHPLPIQEQGLRAQGVLPLDSCQQNQAHSHCSRNRNAKRVNGSSWRRLNGSLRKYFPDQQSLFAEAFAIGTQEIISRVDARIAGGQIGSLRDLARLYVDFLLENDHYFRMMTHFMLDGRLEGQPLERLNQAARAILELFERLLSGTGADAHLSAHAFFAALNGILISFRQYPGRSPEAVRRHMQTLADLLARRFEESTGPQ